MHESENETEVTQSCPTLSDPMDCSQSVSSVHGIFPGKSTGVGGYCLLWIQAYSVRFYVYVVGIMICLLVNKISYTVLPFVSSIVFGFS